MGGETHGSYCLILLDICWPGSLTIDSRSLPSLSSLLVNFDVLSAAGPIWISHSSFVLYLFLLTRFLLSASLCCIFRSISLSPLLRQGPPSAYPIVKGHFARPYCSAYVSWTSYVSCLFKTTLLYLKLVSEFSWVLCWLFLTKPS